MLWFLITCWCAFISLKRILSFVFFFFKLRSTYFLSNNIELKNLGSLPNQKMLYICTLYVCTKKSTILVLNIALFYALVLMLLTKFVWNSTIKRCSFVTTYFDFDLGMWCTKWLGDCSQRAGKWKISNKTSHKVHF